MIMYTVVLCFKMDFENIMTPFIIRNNNEATQETCKGDIIQISSESDNGEEGEQRLSNNNSNSLVQIGFTKKSIDIRNCYEFLGLQAHVDNPERSEVVTEILRFSKQDYYHRAEKENASCGINKRCSSQKPSSNFRKINLKQRSKKHVSRTRKREQYQDFMRFRHSLGDILLPDGSHSKLDILGTPSK